MSDLQSTLDAIDQLAVHQCGHCQEPLAEDSTSLDFCSNVCQTAWTRNKHEIVALLDYEEPTDLPQHVSNLVELSSPETTPACSCLRCQLEAAGAVAFSRRFAALMQARRQARAMFRPPTNIEVAIGPPGPGPIPASEWTSIGVTSREDLPEPEAPVTLGWDPAGGAVVAAQRMPDGNIYTRLAPDLSQLREAAQRAAEGITQVAEVMRQAGFHLTQWQEQMLLLQQAPRDRPATFRREWLNQLTPAEPTPVPDPMQRALELRRNRNTGPAVRQRAPRRIDARRTR